MFVLSLIDSGYEERQKANLQTPYKEYAIDLHRMNSSGALWDTDKLNFINNIYLSKISNQQLFDETLNRAQQYRPEFATLISSDPVYALAAMSIERHTELDPKRFSTYADVQSQITFFFDSEYNKLLLTKPALPEMMTPELIEKFAVEYSDILDLTMTKEEWFAQLKEIGKKYGFAGSNGEFKE